MADFPYAFLAVSLAAIAFIVSLHILVSLMLWQHIRRPLSLLLLALLALITTITWNFAGIVIGAGLSLSQENFPLEESSRWHIWQSTLGLPIDNLGFVLVAISLYFLSILFSVNYMRLGRH
jgi:hypothetical protein